GRSSGPGERHARHRRRARSPIGGRRHRRGRHIGAEVVSGSRAMSDERQIAALREEIERAGRSALRWRFGVLISFALLMTSIGVIVASRDLYSEWRFSVAAFVAAMAVTSILTAI